MIAEWKRQQTGSESRDVFKSLHKNQVADNCYSLDLDFVFVEKNIHNGAADPCIVAVCDFKKPGDRVQFSEAIAYNTLVSKGVPVYIIECNDDQFVDLDPTAHTFDIIKYDGGDWRPQPPDWDGTVIESGVGWDGLEAWESRLRIKRRKEVRDV